MNTQMIVSVMQMFMDTQMIVSVMQMLLTFGNLCIMAYAFSKFLTRPHDTLEQKVNTLTIKVEEIEESLKQGNDRFRELNTTTEVLINSTLALIEFEIQYCYTENKPISNGLEEAKNNLNRFLARRSHGTENRND